MYVAIKAASRTARQPFYRQSKLVASSSISLHSKSFHSSASIGKSPDDPKDSSLQDGLGSVEGKSKSETAIDSATGATTKRSSEVQNGALQKGEKSKYAGSAHRRQLRNIAPKELPRVDIPAWFTAQNVVSHSENHNSRKSSEEPVPTDQSGDALKTPVSSLVTLPEGQINDVGSSSTMPSKDRISRDFRSLESFLKYAKDELRRQEGRLRHQEELVRSFQTEFQSAREIVDSSPVEERPKNVEPDIGDQSMKLFPRTSGHEQPEQEFKEFLSHDIPREIAKAIGYGIHQPVYEELLATCHANLSLRPPSKIPASQIPRPDTVLLSPSFYGSCLLRDTVFSIASDLEADLVNISPDSLAEIVGGYLGENVAWTYSDTSLLSYEVHKILARRSRRDGYREHTDNNAKPDSLEAVEEADDEMTSLAAAVKRNGGFLVDVLPEQSTQSMSLSDFLDASASSGSSSSAQTGNSWEDLKMTAALEAIVDAAIQKRAARHHGSHVIDMSVKGHGDPKDDQTLVASSADRLIIHVSHHQELDRIPKGRMLLQKLREIVKKRWLEGSNIIIIGTTAVAPPASNVARARDLQSHIVRNEYRMIVVPTPGRLRKWMLKNHALGIGQINSRHIRGMIEALGGKVIGMGARDPPLFPRPVIGLPESYDYGYVYRIAHAAICAGDTIVPITPDHVRTVIENIMKADIYKMGGDPSDSKRAISEAMRGHLAPGLEAFDSHPEDTLVTEYGQVKPGWQQNLDGPRAVARRNASRHEKKLLAGIIDPDEITTSFADIRAPAATIEALKTLTSLSLKRPEAFKYGILATQKIPGILLYGPPGTGKTMLAKAVAKECGATVLEVSGSEINDMYVGEGEKNVKALFSLAKKLSPCVIFIDEADGLFAARGGSSTGQINHRELINQFLRELDGMTEFTGILMVATNRPFDLDEAVLRRLPRRLLVDLPVEADREAILRLHLADETLDSTVDLAAIARDTPLYSGSDLKNLSVAAALACVREENDAAAQHSGDESYTYPETRTLTKAHFDKAMEEISASISEDMSTLKAIRKFDERYGDRKGRRKKAAGIGFSSSLTPKVDHDAGRVRTVAAEKA